MAREAKKKNAALKEELHSKYAKMRKVYRKVINSKTATYEEKEEAQKKLGQLPRRSCKTQLRNRCVVTGRCRGYSRKFGLSRIKLREMFCEGLLPGVKKASW